MKESKINVGIVYGGSSVERQVSILSALTLEKGFDKNKYDITMIYMDQNNHFYIGEALSKLSNYNSNFLKIFEVNFSKGLNSKVQMFKRKRMKSTYIKDLDIILPLVHGKDLENGMVSSYFRMLGGNVCSSDITSLSIMQNKALTKELLKTNNIDTLTYLLITEKKWLQERKQCLSKIDNFPIIIKPNTLGSSVAINVTYNIHDTIMAVKDIFTFDDSCIIEEKLTNYREFNCAVLKTNDECIISAIEEVFSNKEFYTYENKYIDKKKIEIATISEELKKEIETTTIKVSEVLETFGVIRVDYLYDNMTNKLYVNEVNGIPGSLSYYLFEKNGLYINEFIDKIIFSTIKYEKNKHTKITNVNSSILNNYYNSK